MTIDPGETGPSPLSPAASPNPGSKVVADDGDLRGFGTEHGLDDLLADGWRQMEVPS